MKKEKTIIFKFKPKEVPTTPGCYLFWGKNDYLLYVGKAKNLRKRVSSYFKKTKKSLKNKVMVPRIIKIETRTVHSEMEALILENNLIKEFNPRFNIRLKDDKNFVYLHLTKEEFPKMEITRRILRDNSYYLGPKTSTKEFKKTIRFCQKFFRIRMVKPADDYYPHLVSGKLNSNKEEYLRNVTMMKQFLNGKTSEVLKILTKKMTAFAKEKNFEAAAKTRDLVQSIKTSTQKQNVQFADTVSRDFLYFIHEENQAFFVRFVFRNGNLIDQNEIIFKAPDFFEEGEVLEQFLLQFYPHVDKIPAEIFVQSEPENTKKINKHLGVKILVPQRGNKLIVLKMAKKNAKYFLERKKIETLSHAENFAKALPELAEALELNEPPQRIECFDVSHFAGDSPVASQIVFINGEPKNSEYRRFKIKSLPDGKIDDFASMEEILSRRFARKDDKQFAEKFPDLIVIDGGKGQLTSVMKAVARCKKDKCFPKGFKEKLQIIALAKQEEEIFRPGKKEPLLLSQDSSALKLLQRVRDEAHRFAITFNRVARQKKAQKSVLDGISGIGPTTKKALLQRFDSVSGIRKAKTEDLLAIVSKSQLENLKKHL